MLVSECPCQTAGATDLHHVSCVLEYIRGNSGNGANSFRHHLEPHIFCSTTMAPSPLHMLAFSLHNSYTLSLDRDSPFRVLFRGLRSTSPTVHTLDLSGHAGSNILITGATSGCGLELAIALSRVRCHLLITSRDHDRGEQIRKQILGEAKRSESGACVDVLDLDMTSPRSIRNIAARVHERVPHLDIAILNAGVYQTSMHICPESGFEETVQVNTLATAALSVLLRGLLARSDRGKMLIVSSEAHAWADPREGATRDLVESLNRSERILYPCYQRYHISKLLNILWANQIASRAEWDGVKVAAVSPGYTRSNLFRDFSSSLFTRAIERVACRTSEEGASEYICALNNMKNGGFWSDGQWRRLVLAEIGRRQPSHLHIEQTFHGDDLYKWA